MIELYSQLSNDVKRRAEFMVEMILRQNEIPTAVKLLKDYVDNCTSEEEKDFVDFYFNLKMEQMLNER